MTDPNNPNSPLAGTPGADGDATRIGGTAPFGDPSAAPGQVPPYGSGPGFAQYGSPAYGPPGVGAANPFAAPTPGQYGPPGQQYPQPGQQFGQPGQQYPQSGQQYPQPGQQYAQPGQQYAQQQYAQPTPAYGQQPGQQPGQFGSPQYGSDPFGGAQPTGSSSDKKLPKVLGAVGGVILAIAVIVLVTGFWLPGWFPKTLSQSAVEDGVKKVLSTDYNIDNVDKVSCPSGQSVSSGKSFTCDLTVGGQQQKVTITIVDDDGKYEVSRPTS
ncbi:DUF4333 domain-containing protein [Gordonia pseudamarae]|uniref:DUF4333 domain-containing protein n=1 Tax=Gordonia TaxID=2053 RepID=UPI00198C2415|nr:MULTISPECIES: DUF4333 domain-containing protein [Gordonia]MBD0021414.1 DUF4333 domain-containing protein [Gordonia sp. (in: high G+C Gram-positive bacteria)]QHN26419.1 DUF4333 domain-containing protein [Gordonia pseudamarae]